MSDCEAAPEIFIPDFGDMPQGVRFLLTVLERWADVRGSIDATEAELSAYTGMGESTVRKHLAWASAEARGWVSRSERRRRADGTLSGYRYWLRLEKFAGHPDHRSNRAVVRGVDEAVSTVGNPVDEPPLNSSGGAPEPPLDLSKPPPNSSGGASDLSGGEGPFSKAFEALPRERARAFPFSNSYFLSFPWRDEAMALKAGEILEACGPGIGQLGAQNNRVLNSLAYVLEAGGLWSDFDLALDVLPVVRLKTGPGRVKPLWDFALLVENLEAHRARRLRPVGAVKSKAKAPKPPAEMSAEERARARTARIAGHRNVIAGIDRGELPTWLLSKEDRRLSGEWLDDAFVRLRTKYASELAALEAEAIGGTDNIQAGATS